MTVNKEVTIDEIHAHLKARDRHYADLLDQYDEESSQ